MTEINPTNSTTGADANYPVIDADTIKKKLAEAQEQPADTSFIKPTSENDLAEYSGEQDAEGAAETDTADETKTDGDSETGETKTDESTEGESSTGGQTTSGATNSTIALLQLQQQEYLNEISRLNQEIQSAMKNRQKAEASLAKLKARNADTSDIQSRIDGYTSNISSLNSQRDNALNQFNSINTQIIQAINQASNTQATSSTAASSGTSATAETSGVADTSGVNQGTLANYNAEKGQALANAANELYGNNPYSGGMCGQGVSDSIARGLGLSICGNGCDYRDLLRNDSHFVEVTDQYPTVESLYDLPAGAIVSWQPYNTTSAGSIYGHVYISDGNGNEISDFKSAMWNEHYADGGSYTVFFPV